MKHTRRERTESSPPVPVPTTSDNGPSLMLMSIARRWWLVAGCVAVCLLLAAVKAMRTPLLYQATSTLYIQEGSGLGAASNNGRELNLYAECKRIQSTPALVMALGINDIRSLPMLASSTNPLDVLRQGVVAELGRDDQLVNVSFSARDPDDAQKINEAIIAAYQELTQKRTESHARTLLKQVQQEQTNEETEVQQKSQALIDFQIKNGLLMTGDGKGSLMQDRLNSLSNALTAAHLQTLQDQAEYERLAEAAHANPEIMRQVQLMQATGQLPLATDVAQIRSDLYQLQQNLKSLLQHYLPDHPLVKAVQVQIMQRDAAYYLAIRQQYEAAKSHEQDLQASYDKQHQIALALQKKQLEFARLQDELNRARQRAGNWEDRVKQFSLSDDLPPITSTVVAQNTEPRSRTTMILFEGLLVGLMLGVGATFLDTRFRSADEIRAGVGLSILGGIPHTHGRQSNSIRGRKVHLDPTSEVAEAYRSVRTALYFGAADDQTRSILVTSPSQGDGKSTLTANLAITMAQAGQRTLLLDGDLRKPQQHRIFQVDDALGLSMVLAGQCQIGDAIQRTGIRDLDVLPAGPIPPNPTEILNSDRFESLLHDLMAQYDHVLIDAPPVGPVSDARILAAMSEATLLVLRAEKSSRKSSAQARDALLSVGANLLGVVVNNIPRRKVRYGTFGPALQAYYGHPRASLAQA